MRATQARLWSGNAQSKLRVQVASAQGGRAGSLGGRPGGCRAASAEATRPIRQEADGCGGAGPFGGLIRAGGAGGWAGWAGILMERACWYTCWHASCLACQQAEPGQPASIPRPPA